MAPKKGGSSSGSSGGSSGSSSISSCEECLSKMELIGFQWSNGRLNALFAFNIIAVIVLIACLFLAARFKWVRKVGRDKLRHSGYIWAVSCAICYFLLLVIDTALSETETVVTHLYYIIYILESAFWRISEILILAIILRTLYESSASKMVSPLPKINAVATTLLTLISMAGFGLYTADTASAIANGSFYYYRSFNDYGGYVDFGYDVLYLIVAIIVAIYSLLIFIKERSKATILMATVVAPALFLRILFTLASQGVISFPSGVTYDSSLGLRYANSFFYVLMDYPIFLGVAFIGCIKPRDPNFLMEQKPTGTAYQNGLHGLPIEYTPNGAPQTYQGAPQGYQPVYYNTGVPNAHANGRPGAPAAQYGQPLIA